MVAWPKPDGAKDHHTITNRFEDAGLAVREVFTNTFASWHGANNEVQPHASQLHSARRLGSLICERDNLASFTRCVLSWLASG